MIFKSICDKCFSNAFQQLKKSICMPKSSQLVRRSFTNIEETDSKENGPFQYFSIESGDRDKPCDYDVTILHGLFGSSFHFRSFNWDSAFNHDVKTYVHSPRNLSPKHHSKEFNYDLIAKDLLYTMKIRKKFKKNKNIKKHYLMGHCIGGRAMMAAALYEPETVDKLIVIDASPLPMPPEFREYKKYLEAIQSIKLELNAKRTEKIDAVYDALKNDVDPFLRNFIIDVFESDSANKHKWAINVDSLIDNFENGIMDFPQARMGKKFEGETHFIYGSLSNHIRMPEDEERIREIFPNAKFHEVEDSGHFVHIEEPQQFRSIVYPILKNEPYRYYTFHCKWKADSY